MSEQRSDPDAANVEAAEISLGNQISTTVSGDRVLVRCRRCSRELTALRSIRAEAGRDCRRFLEQGVAA